MARVRTRAQLRTEVLQRADMENTSFVTDAELNRYINESISELYDLIIEAAGQEYFLDTYTFNTVANQDTYPLPSDFYMMKGVDIDVGASEPVPIRPYMFDERHDTYGYPAGWGQFQDVRYRLLGLARGPADEGISGVTIGTVDQIGIGDGLPSDFDMNFTNRSTAEALYVGQSLIYDELLAAEVVAAINPTTGLVTFTNDIVAAGMVSGDTISTATPGDYTGQLRFTPDPTGVNPVTVWYIPYAPELTADTDVWNGFNG